MVGKEAFLADIKSLASQIEEASRLGKDEKVLDEIDKIVVTGMGGSALPGKLLKAYLNIRLPVFVFRDYDLPEFINKRTLVFVISYSGNTEETLSAFKVALRKGCRVVGLSSGGKLKEFCSKYNFPHILIPSGLQPRMALGYLFSPLLNVLYNSHIIKDPAEDVKATITALKKVNFEEKAKHLAEKLTGKIPIIYSSNNLAMAAYKWKIDFNENSKIHAFNNTFPELDHNEITGYTKLNAYYFVIILEDEADNRRVKDRMKFTKELITKQGVEVTQIAITGDNLLTRIMLAIHLGDLTSYYLGMLNKLDPEAVEMQENIKKKMSEKKF